MNVYAFQAESEFHSANYTHNLTLHHEKAIAILTSEEDDEVVGSRRTASNMAEVSELPRICDRKSDKIGCASKREKRKVNGNRKKKRKRNNKERANGWKGKEIKALFTIC